jgi:FkbM family methyltransferase
MNKLKKYIKNTIKSKPKDNIEKVGDYFCKDYDDLRIYTHDVACIKRAFKQIFKKNAYDFNCSVDDPLIIDAGANIGLGVLYWKRKYPKAKIIAFEPSKLAYESLLKNVKENKLDNVTCINKALSNVEGTQQFTTNELISGSLNTYKDLPFNYEVETTTLGQYLDKKIDFLKIDIEGAERLIFDDIEKQILNLNYIFLEYHSFVNEPQYLSKYLNLFEDNGFRYYMEGGFSKVNYFVEERVTLNQDMQLNIWVSKDSI